MNNKGNNLLTEQDVHHFLINAYFGSVDDPLYVAANSAYLDMNRTIEFKKNGTITAEKKEELRNNVVSLIKTEIQDFIKNTKPSQDLYDDWHSSLCNAIIKSYTDANVPFHYGQAQKWINMTMKYLCVLNHSEANKIVHLMHLPIDSIVFERADDLLTIPYPEFRWSRMTEDQYKEYLGNIRDALSKQNPSYAPMIWELKNWER